MTRKAFFISGLMPFLMDTACEAGRGIMLHYRTNQVVDRKHDESPVTEADREADRFIVARLKALVPDVPAVSEEGEKPDAASAEYFWLVDPLDGTKSFVRGHGYFTVNIALIKNRMPVVGVIYDPANDAMYWGSEEGAFRKIKNAPPEPMRGRAVPETGPVAIVSHSHINEKTRNWLMQAGANEHMPCASSIKFCRLAEGVADIYPRFGPTSEWDTAAGHAILTAAGGSLTTPDGEPFLYGKKDFLNGDFVARSSPQFSCFLKNEQREQ